MNLLTEHEAQASQWSPTGLVSRTRYGGELVRGCLRNVFGCLSQDNEVALQAIGRKSRRFLSSFPAQ